MKKLILFPLYLLCSTIFIFIICELSLTLFSNSVPTFVNYEYYPNLVGDLPPSLDVRDNLITGLPYHVKTNSQGLRSDQELREKDEDVVRVLCLGDSFTYGVGVDNNQTYPSLLEHYLKEKYPHSKIEVINFGAPFFDIVDELDQWIEKGKSLRPDLVIVQFYINDIQTMDGTSFRREQRRGKKKFNNISHFIKNSKIFSLASMLAYNIQKFRHETPPVNNSTSDPWYSGRYCTDLTDSQIDIIRSKPLNQEYSSLVQCRWEQYIHNLLDLKKSIEESGADLLFVNIPDTDQITKNKYAPSLCLNSMLTQHNIKHIDFLPLFRGMYHRERLKIYNTPLDFHTTPAGNTLIAKTISNVIEINGGRALAKHPGKFYDFKTIASAVLFSDNGNLQFDSKSSELFSNTINCNEHIHLQGTSSAQDHVDALTYDKSPGTIDIELTLKNEKEYIEVMITPAIFNNADNGEIKLYILLDNGENLIALNRSNDSSVDEQYIFSHYSPGNMFKKVILRFVIGESTAIVFDKKANTKAPRFLLSLG